MQTVSIGLVDANNLFRQGLKALFTDPDVQITKEASSLDGAVRTFSEGDAPDLILIDPVGIGESSAVIQAIKAACSGAKIVLLTGALDTTLMTAAIGAGVDGYLMKDISPDALIQSLRLVMVGEKVFPSHLAAMLISGRMSTSEPDVRGSGKGLSQREAQILRCLLNGDANKVIANHLNITEATVKVHLKSLLRKINAANRTQAAIWALNHGFGEGKVTSNAANALPV